MGPDHRRAGSCDPARLVSWRQVPDATVRNLEISVIGSPVSGSATPNRQRCTYGQRRQSFPNLTGELGTDLTFDPVRRGGEIAGMAHPKDRQDIDLAQNLLIQVRRPLRNHRDAHAPDATLFHQAAYRSQAMLLLTVFQHLRSERVRLIYIEVESPCG